MLSKKYNVKKILQKYNIRYKVVSGTREANVNCVFHEDTKYKMYINLSSGAFNCFVCNERGNIHKLLDKINVSSFPVDLKNFEFGSDVFIPKTEVKQNLFKMPENLEFLSDETAKIKSAFKDAFDYLQRRGITNNQIYLYKLCVSPTLPNRIIFPVIENGEYVSWVARTYSNGIPKVLTPRAVDGTHGIKEYVYNLDKAAKTKQLIITEGTFDCLSVGPSGVCIFGKTATMTQLAKIIAARPRRVTVCLDPDAQKDALFFYNQLISHVEDVKFVLLPKGEDPNSLLIKDSSYLKTLVETPLDYSNFYSKYIGA